MPINPKIKVGNYVVVNKQKTIYKVEKIHSQDNSIIEFDIRVIRNSEDTSHVTKGELIRYSYHYRRNVAICDAPYQGHRKTTIFR